MNPESDFIVRKVWELVELCAEQRRHCRWVNMEDFRNALDSWEIGRKDAYAALLELEQGNYLLTMRRGEGDTITYIVITPEEEPPSKSSQRFLSPRLAENTPHSNAASTRPSRSATPGSSWGGTLLLFTLKTDSWIRRGRTLKPTSCMPSAAWMGWETS